MLRPWEQDTFKHVMHSVDEAPDNLAQSIHGITHTAFVDHFITKMRDSGVDYYSSEGKTFAKKLLSHIKSLKPYFAQKKRDLDAADITEQVANT